MLEGEWKIGQNDEEFLLKKDSLLILKANHLHYGVPLALKIPKPCIFTLTKYQPPLATLLPLTV
jgi:hypothetical protein